MDWMGGVRIWNACGNQYYLTGGSGQLAARPGPIRHSKMHTFTARCRAGSVMPPVGPLRNGQGGASGEDIGDAPMADGDQFVF